MSKEHRETYPYKLPEEAAQAVKDINEMQRGRRVRGEDFQDEIRKGWKLVAGTWRLRLTDGGGGTRPADEVVLSENVNILNELKRTEGDRFELGFLRPDQQKGLLLFEKAVPKKHRGLVFISFNSEHLGLDEAYAFRFATAVKFMAEKKRKYITLVEFRREAIPCIELPRIYQPELTYDLTGVLECYRYL